MAKSLIGIDVNGIEAGMISTNGQMYKKTLPDNVIDRTGIVSPESSIAADFFTEFRKETKIKGKDCGLVLPVGTAFYKSFTSGIQTDEQIKLNLPYEFKNYVGGEPQKYSYDYFVEGVVNDEAGNPTELKLVAAAGLKQKIEEFATCFRQAGLNLTLALPREVCLINLMKKTASPDKEYCLVGVDEDNTCIYLFAGGKLEATKVVDLGAHDIDLAIAKLYNIDEKLAAVYRNDNHDNCLYNPLLTDIYDSIALEVMKAINFYRYEHSDCEINTAYFFGMAANNDALCYGVCNRIDFTQGDITEILPDKFKKVEGAESELYSIGLVLSEVK